MRLLFQKFSFLFFIFCLTGQAQHVESPPHEAGEHPPGDESNVQEINLTELERQLSAEGVVGEVHAIRAEDSMYVFTYRNPNNFFEFLHFSMLAQNETVGGMLKTLKRHDKVRLKGVLIENRSKQKHIEVSSIELVRAYENPYKPDAYDHVVSLPEDLLSKSSADFLVHAVHKDGEILVLEYGDVVVPLFIKKEQAMLTKDLYRNDVVTVHFQVMRHPKKPTHLMLNPSVQEPLKVVHSVKPMHGQRAEVTGALILFPKSPQVLFDVFAVQEKLPNGLQRQFTLINFDSPETFAKIRKKCEEAWATDPTGFVNGRNKLVHQSIKVRARGTFNVVDSNQANVQIIIDNLEDLEIVK